MSADDRDASCATGRSRRISFVVSCLPAIVVVAVTAAVAFCHLYLNLGDRDAPLRSIVLGIRWGTWALGILGTAVVALQAHRSAVAALLAFLLNIGSLLISFFLLALT